MFRGPPSSSRLLAAPRRELQAVPESLARQLKLVSVLLEPEEVVRFIGCGVTAQDQTGLIGQRPIRAAYRTFERRLDFPKVTPDDLSVKAYSRTDATLGLVPQRLERVVEEASQKLLFQIPRAK